LAEGTGSRSTLAGRRRRPIKTVRRTRRGGWWALAGSVALGLLSLVLVVSAVAGVLYVRISHGPISLKFLAGHIERGINAELVGFESRVDDAVVGLSEAGSLELRLINLRVAEPDGDVVVNVPTAAVELSRSALASWRLVPTRIDLIGPRLFLTYTQAGGLGLSVARDGLGEKLGGSLNGVVAPVRKIGGELPVGHSPSDAIASARRIDIGALITSAAAQARQRQNASSYLKQVGIRDGVLALDDQGVRSEWRIREASASFVHNKGHSSVAVEAQMGSERGPWSFTFDTQVVPNSQAVLLRGSLRDVVPRLFGLAIPQLSLLETLDAPVSGEGTISLQPGGGVASGALALSVGRGQFQLPTIADVPFGLENGQINLAYDGVANRFDLARSTFAWGSSRIAVAGSVLPQPAPDGAAGWVLDLATQDGVLAADEFRVPAVDIQTGVVKARIVPGRGEVQLDSLRFKAGGADIQANGLFLTGVSQQAGSARLDATLGPMAVETLKVLWPRALAAGARTWVGQRISKGQVKSGSLKFVSGAFARDAGVVAGAREQRLSFAMEAGEITANPLKWLGAVEAPRALIRLEDNAIEIAVPDATVVVSPTRRVPLKAGRFAAAGLNAPAPEAEITFRGLAPLVPVLDVLDQSPLRLLRANDLTTDGLDGKVDASIKLTLPLIADLSGDDVKITGKAKVSDAKAKQLGGAFDVQGATIAIDISEASIEAKGDMLVSGVPAKLAWQRVFEANGEKQPPLRLSATLDNADRVALGIDINHIVQGEMPIEVLVEKGLNDETSVKVRADLTNAEIALESIAWRKPPGRAATLQADIVKGKVQKIELQNLKVVGDDIAIEGMAAISADNRLRELVLPSFSLNVVTRLDVHAQFKDTAADKAGVWQVKVRGPTFDGRDLFKSLFSVGQGGATVGDKTGKGAKPRSGVDLDIEVDNVIGFSDVSLRGLKCKMSRRGDKMVSMDARGTLDGGAQVVLSMDPASNGPRTLLSDTTDAGQAFKLIGFYPNMQSGRARLELNVDGRGPAEKTGTLWVEDFRVLGDPIVSEVLGSAAANTGEQPGGAPATARQKKAGPQREVFEFDRMKVPFSVGYNQFVLEEAYLRGPLLGVNMRGKVDFKLRSLNLGGTYVPVQGLNNAFGGVPLLGDLVSGPRGEGAFGITFAVQGPMAQPQVLVNPLSLVAPGIFREMFQMTSANPKVVPRDEVAPKAPVEKRVRATPPGGAEPERAGRQALPQAGASGSLDGWVVREDKVPVTKKKP
jgi:hypothetical protein